MSENETVFKQLILQSQKGDRATYSQLLQGLSSFLKNYLRKRIFDKNDIDEVIQEILMAVHKSIHTYNAEKSFMSWFMAIVEYKVIDYIRHLKKNLVDVDVKSNSDVAAALETDNDLRIDVENAVNQLNPRERQVFTMVKINGLSISEVANELLISEANVKVIVYRANMNLKIMLGSQS